MSMSCLIVAVSGKKTPVDSKQNGADAAASFAEFRFREVHAAVQDRRVLMRDVLFTRAQFLLTLTVIASTLFAHQRLQGAAESREGWNDHDSYERRS